MRALLLRRIGVLLRRAPLAALPSLAAALAAAAAPGCSENQAGLFHEHVMRPSSAPKFLTPSPGAQGVSPVPRIHVGYESAIDYSRAAPDLIQLYDLGPNLSTPTRVAIAIAASEDGRGFEVVPIAQLVAPRTFEVRVLGRTTGLRFASGDDTDDFSFRFTTAGDPAFTTLAGALPEAKHGVPYGPVQLAVSGGAPPIGFAVTEGTLPGGLALDLSIGRIAGTPAVAPPGTKTFRFSVTATDAIGRTATRTFTIEASP